MNWFSLKQLRTATSRTVKVGQHVMMNRDFVVYVGGHTSEVKLKRDQFIMVEVVKLGGVLTLVRAYNTTKLTTSDTFAIPTEDLTRRDGVIILSILAFYFFLNLVTGKYFRKGGIPA